MQIAGSWDAQPGQETWLAFDVGEQTLEARGVVVWSSRSGTGEGFRWGIRFTALHEQTAELIADYVQHAYTHTDEAGCPEYQDAYEPEYQRDSAPMYDDDEPPTLRWSRPRDDDTEPQDVPDMSAEAEDEDEDEVPVVSGNTQVVSIDDIIARGGAPGEEVRVEDPPDTDTGAALPVIELPKDLIPIEAWPDSVPARNVPPREPIPDHSGPLPVSVPGSVDHSGPLPLSVPFGSSQIVPAREDSVHAPLVQEYRAPLPGSREGRPMTVPIDMHELQSLAQEVGASGPTQGSTEVPPPPWQAEAPAPDAWQTSEPGAPPWQHEPAGFVAPQMQPEAADPLPRPYLIDLPDSYVGPLPSSVSPNADEGTASPTAVTHALPPLEPSTGVTDVASPSIPSDDASSTAVTNALPSPEPPTGVTNAQPRRPAHQDVSLTAVTNAVPGDQRRSRRHRRKRAEPAPAELPLQLEPEPEEPKADADGPDPISSSAFESPEDRHRKIEAILATAKRRPPGESDPDAEDATKVATSEERKKATPKAERAKVDYDTQQRRQRRELQELFRAALDQLQDGA